MTYLEAAREVLSTADRPLSAKEIAGEVLRRRLVSPRGATPEATLASALYTYRASHPDGDLVRSAETAQSGRGRRGTVRWAIRK